MECPSCKAANPDSNKFCSHCGVRLRAAGAGSPSALELAISSAERRHLTVMVCDLVGSTALSARLDPEDLHEVIAAYYRYVAEAVAPFGGFISKYMGDGVLIYFGYPRAHEHDAERAVRAGLTLATGLAEYPWPPTFVPQLRVGIATGMVVVDLGGDDAAQEHSIIGEPPSLAMRLQAFAEPNSVVIDANTRRLTAGLFDYRDLGPLALKGFAGPVMAAQVVGPSAATSRFEALHEAGVAPLLGRDEELDLLLRLWRQARNGEGRVVLLSGEPGIGKTRLVAALSERIAGEPHRRMRFFCSPDHTDSALHPVIAQFERAADFAREDSPAEKLDKLAALLSRRSTSARDASLIGGLLALADVDRRYPRLDLTPQQRKQHTLEALWRQIEMAAVHQPLLLVFEDVQWIDPTSLELLHHIVEQAPRLRLMTLVTCRPDSDSPWARQSHVHELVLNRLPRAVGATLVGRIKGSDALASDTVEEIIERTDGVPLFIEELTRAVVESGAARDVTGARDVTAARDATRATPADQYRIPPTLHASLASRLDRLGPAKELAQIGAVIGRRFSHQLLTAVADRGDAELLPLLDQLTATGLIFQEGTPPEATFLFKHALVQDAAYGSLLRSTRQHIHARIATILEAQPAEPSPELLAQHWAQAGDPEKAVSYWRKAGEQAIRRCANREAIAQLTKGLRTLDSLPPEAARDHRELGLQLLLAEALMADKGWTAPEIQACYARARELCDRVGDTAGLFPVLYGQFSRHLSRGESDAAHGLALQTLRLAKKTREPALLFMARSILAMNFFSRGEFVVARAGLQKALALHQVDSHSHTFLAPGHNFSIASMWLGLSLLLLGYPEQASERIAAGLHAARELSNPHTLAHALALACRYHSVLGEAVALRGASDELAAVAAEHEFPFYRAAATIYQGWVLADTSNDLGRALELLREGLAEFVSLGATALRPYFSAKIAGLSAAMGADGNGIDLLDEALEQVAHSGQRWCEAELHRAKAELLRGFDAAQAERCFQRSLATARRQQARFWELRAACSLGRLWSDQGRQDEARHLLDPVHGWFTEGHHTPDMKASAALLAGLR
jgi:class 3 adenylate cyclase/predicted ATPase